MSLTSQDLQAIGDLIEEKLETKLESKLDERFDNFEQKFDQKLDERFENFGQKIDKKFDQKLEPIRKDLRKIKKTLDETISFFDREFIDHSRRLDNIENHLGLPKFVNPA